MFNKARSAALLVVRRLSYYLYRGNAARNLSGIDRPDRIVTHTRRLPNRVGSARLKQTRMASEWKMIAPIHTMLALINPAALPALRIAATFFFMAAAVRVESQTALLPSAIWRMLRPVFTLVALAIAASP